MIIIFSYSIGYSLEIKQTKGNGLNEFRRTILISLGWHHRKNRKVMLTDSKKRKNVLRHFFYDSFLLQGNQKKKTKYSQ